MGELGLCLSVVAFTVSMILVTMGVPFYIHIKKDMEYLRQRRMRQSF